MPQRASSPTIKALDYETSRLKRIEENRRAFEALGLNQAKLNPNLSKPIRRRFTPQKRRPCRSSTPIILRRSARLDPSGSIAAADVEGKSKRIRYYDPPLSRSARALRELQAVPANITLDSLPLSVPGYSGGFTLISLGKIVVGPHENLFWSSPQCLYSHLYPVGYVATRIHWGLSFEMTIQESAEGPLFTVRQENGAVFSGSSPTFPWTQHCLARKTGERISGPLFFGFSAPITIKLIKSLPGYEEVSNSIECDEASEETRN